MKYDIKTEKLRKYFLCVLQKCTPVIFFSLKAESRTPTVAAVEETPCSFDESVPVFVSHMF